MNLRNVKILIIITIILIVITIIGIILYRKLNPEGVLEEENVEEFDAGLEYEKNDQGFEILDDYNMAFSVIDIIEKYLDVLRFDIDNVQYVNQFEIENEEQLKNYILTLLDEKYVEDNHINMDNLYDYITTLNYGYNVIPVEIKVRYGEVITDYIIGIYFENLQTNELTKQYYIVRIDGTESTFSIEPVQGAVNNIDDIYANKTNYQIEDKVYNKYNLITVAIEDVAKMYMNNFVRLMTNYPDIVYENYINEEYKEKRFGTVDNFKKFVNNNKEELSRIIPTRYLLDFTDTGKIYVIMDQYNNTYEFYETETFLYTVKMDTYTMLTEKFKTTYDSSDIQYKVAMNIDKWVQMLNNRDYKAAYNVLDETFRNNNWGSEEAFEQYIKESLPLHYDVEYTTFREENSTYIQEIILSDITGENEEIININIIMQLKDNYEFVMSFSKE